VKAKVDPLGLFNPMDYSTHVLVSANCVNVTSPQTELSEKSGGGGKSKCAWIYTDFYKWSLISQNSKMALMVSVFSDETFKRRLEFHFRTKEAVRLATAIEFFIEKFMSVMHIMLERAPAAEQDALREQPKSSLSVPTPQEVPSAPEASLLDFFSSDEGDVPPLPTPQGEEGSSAAFTTSSTSSGFSDDPFSSSPFGSSSDTADSAAAPLTPAQAAQHGEWLQSARINGGGPLYDDGSVQIACKTEVRGSQGRLTLYFRNKSTVNTIESLSVQCSDTDGFLRSQFGPLPASLAPGCQVEQQVMIECMKPSDVKPVLSIVYKESSGPLKTNDVLLPLHMTLFNDPLLLGNDDFNNRWQMLSGQGQEGSICIIRKTPLSQDQAVQIFEKVNIYCNIHAMHFENNMC
jgi:hypothetical protein